MTDILTRQGERDSVDAITVCWCNRIEHHLHADIANRALQAARDSISNGGWAFAPTNWLPAIRNYDRLIASRQQSEQESKLECYAMGAIVALYEYLVDRDEHDNPDEISRAVAECLAMESVYSELGLNANVSDAHQVFDRIYEAERKQHCYLIRRLHPDLRA